MTFFISLTLLLYSTHKLRLTQIFSSSMKILRYCKVSMRSVTCWRRFSEAAIAASSTTSSMISSSFHSKIQLQIMPSVKSILRKTTCKMRTWLTMTKSRNRSPLGKILSTDSSWTSSITSQSKAGLMLSWTSWDPVTRHRKRRFHLISFLLLLLLSGRATQSFHKPLPHNLPSKWRISFNKDCKPWQRRS